MSVIFTPVSWKSDCADELRATLGQWSGRLNFSVDNNEMDVMGTHVKSHFIGTTTKAGNSTATNAFGCPVASVRPLGLQIELNILPDDQFRGSSIFSPCFN